MKKLPRNKREFECLMKQRKAALELCGLPATDYLQALPCNEKGEPLRPCDKDLMCQLQKFALGVSELAYIICGPVEVLLGSVRDGYNESHSDHHHWDGVATYRQIRLTIPNKDLNLPHKIFWKSMLGYVPPAIGTTYGDLSGGTFCAFPGGCE